MTGDSEYLAARFEERRDRLRAVARQMLGSPAEAEDAVGEAWSRIERAEADGAHHLGDWLTTVVARVCVERLRSRNGAAGSAAPPEPGPEALLADPVGLALLVVLEQLPPAERMSFVLHDLFGLPFAEIGAIVERSPDAARQLASRARQRVRGGAPTPDAGAAADNRSLSTASFTED